jgi:hypothetical protein
VGKAQPQRRFRRREPGGTALIAAAFVQAMAAGAMTARQQSHAFDFQFGAWKVTIRARRGTGWTTYTGTHVVTPIWNRASNYGVMEVDGPVGHIEGVQLRLYDPQSHLWNLWFAQSKTGELGEPSRGRFVNGHGEFFERGSVNGVPTLSRTLTLGITANSYRDEIATSSDGGKTWTTTWIARYSRIR